MSHPVDISIIAACRNEARHIRAFLDSILAQDLGCMSWEALISDGMSNDGTREILDAYSERYPNIRVLTNHGRTTSTGLNTAIRASAGRIIMRFDAHTSYAADYCLRSMETLHRTRADNVGGPARTKVEGVKARAIAAAYHSRFSTGGARFHDPDFEGLVDTVPYGCWRREIFDRIGFFDESLVRNQDDEFNLRLLRAGGTIWQNPAIVSWYSPRATIHGLFHQYFQYGFWKVAVIRKHRLPGSWRHLVPAGFILAGMLLGLMWLIAFVTGAALLFTWASGLLLAMVCGYAAANVAASFLSARKNGWDTLILLPTAFAAFHFSYGLGFLAALPQFVVQSRGKLPGNSLFTRITR